MATTLTPNLKLRVSSGLTADARYNLNRLDLLGATFQVDTTSALNIRSVTNINILPESPDIGGSGVGGDVVFGTPSQPLANMTVYADNISFGDNLSLEDQAVGGTKKLRLKYQSDLDGSVDNAADRNLFFDVNGGDRQVILGANLSVLSFDVELNGASPTGSSVNLPSSGTLATLAGVEVLSNKTVDAATNTIVGIVNANISGSAAIAYSKLALSGSIINSDISGSAAIAYSKLALAGSIVNADIATGANIAYSKLNLSNSITNSDIVTAAGIAGSKITPDFGNQIVITQDRLRFQEGGYNIDLRAAQAGLTQNLDFKLPVNHGVAGQVLSTDGTGEMSWIAVGGTGTVTSVDLVAPAEFTVSGNPITTAGTITIGKANQTANLVYAGPSTGVPAAPAFRALVAADLPAGTLTGASDTASVDLTVTGTVLSADVLPAGVNHNALQNYVANQHVDHSTVNINTAANSGLSGGGTIAASRSLLIDPTNAPAVAVATGDILLFADISNSNALSRTTVADIVAFAAGSVAKFSGTWALADGATKAVTHSLGTKDVQVEVYDMTDDSTVLVDSVIRTDTNTVTLTSSVAPGAAGWRVVIIG